MAEKENYFLKLFNTNVSDKIEKKNGLSYVSWPYSWAEAKKQFPDANYTIYENKDGWFYHTDGKTAWVKTGVTINGIEHIEMLPVMDFKNRSIPVDQITSTDVNKAIQRSLTKAVARHGLGLYVYAGEDLPEEEAETRRQEKEAVIQAKAQGKGKAEITTSGKVQELSEAMKYIQNELAFMAEKTGCEPQTMRTQFNIWRKKLEADGVVPKVSATDMTAEQAQQLISEIKSRYLA